MKNVLFIKSSLNAENGNSTLLAQQLVSRLVTSAEVAVIERDLAKDNNAHLSQAEMAAWMTPENERTEQQIALAKVSDNLTKELNISDVVVIAMPMYNFGIPSTFKAWVDRVARAGVTFRYTDNGPVGLLKNKKVIIVAARGGMYAGTKSDSQTQYLTDFFNFIGLDDITFIYAEGLNMPGSEERFAAAELEIKNLDI